MTHPYFAHIVSKKTPFYLYDLDLLEATLHALEQANKKHGFHIHYAIKANANPRIIAEIRKHGLGADCVSGNEVKHAIAQGFAAKEVVFAGVGKSDDEIIAGLDNNIGCFNCESIEEIKVINALAGERGKKTHIAIRINPNIEAGTHEKITTGLSENKFGLTPDELSELFMIKNSLQNLIIDGAHFHIGSQITNLTVFENLAKTASNIVRYLEENGLSIKHINLGGGLGINYVNPEEEPIPDFKAYLDTLAAHIQKRADQEIHLELGRSITGQCGVLVSRVLFVKHGEKKKFIILDAGMTELLRPALYDSVHKIENISADQGSVTYDVVGPVCESSDTFVKNLKLPETKRGDIFLIKSAGAYGEVMKSAYNLREIEAPVFVKSPC